MSSPTNIPAKYQSKDNILKEIKKAIEEYADCRDEFNLLALSQDLYAMVADHATEQTRKLSGG